MSSYIRFETNVPVVAALKFAEGLKVEGQYGDQIMYTTVDDQKMFLSPIVADKIKELGIQRGERIRITKKEVRNGTRRGIEWQVERADEPTPPSNSEVMRHMREQNAAAAEPQPVSTRIDPSLTKAPLGSSNLMAAAVMQAVEAAKAGEEHAKALGMSFKFTEQHLSSFACTIYIQHSKLLGGNTTWQQ